MEVVVGLVILGVCALLLVRRLMRNEPIQIPNTREANKANALGEPALRRRTRNLPKADALSEPALRGRIRDLPRAKVVHIIDGDTVVVGKGWSEIVVRLDSIDCPEDGQYWGDIARYGLIKLIGGREVQVEEHGLDPYGRTLATIYIRHEYEDRWINVNERMVTLGHAWVMRRFYDHLPKDRKDKLNRLENWAKSRKVGLWRATNPVPPWKWRNGRDFCA